MKKAPVSSCLQMPGHLNKAQKGLDVTEGDSVSKLGCCFP